MNPGAVANWNVFDWTIVFPARSRALVSTTTKYVVPDWSSRVGTNVTLRDSALHWKEPSTAGEIENACSTEAGIARMTASASSDEAPGKESRQPRGGRRSAGAPPRLPSPRGG